VVQCAEFRLRRRIRRSATTRLPRGQRVDALSLLLIAIAFFVRLRPGTASFPAPGPQAIPRLLLYCLVSAEWIAAWREQTRTGDERTATRRLAPVRQ
jgi:hypothetical protein